MSISTLTDQAGSEYTLSIGTTGKTTKGHGEAIDLRKADERAKVRLAE